MHDSPLQSPTTTTDRNPSKATETNPRGLSLQEVVERRAKGLGNTVQRNETRTYLQIIHQNTFTFINTVLYAISIGLIAMGLYGDALVTAGLVLLNVLIAVAQEARAKRALDRIALLTRPRVAVIRDAQELEVDASELVVGDIVAVRPGDQIVTDGRLVSGNHVTIDESLLTGESEAITKKVGDQVFSGSFCISGQGIYECQTVGQKSLANQLTASARSFRQEKTPLQADIDFIIRVMALIVIMVGGPVVIDLLVRVLEAGFDWVNEPLSSALEHAYNNYSARETVRAAAVVVAIVPQGLALMIVVTYAASAVRLIGKGALVQQTNAVESLSHVNVLCLDKTGTLTTNNLVMSATHPIDVSDEEFKRLVGDMVASSSEPNRTSAAIAAAIGGTKRPVEHEIAFVSTRKWSAISFAGDDRRGLYVLGAPEILTGSIDQSDRFDETIEDWTRQGKRVLLFARAPNGTPSRDHQDEPVLPDSLVPLGLIAMVDELRPEAGETLRKFAELGVEPKIISGDDPRTVAALATQAGFPGTIQLVSGLDLDGLDDAEFSAIARKGTIFGRTTPKQKERLVLELRDQGHYVAMIGDGVNDILALKRANLAIAVRSGSPATRGVADLVLLNDSFASLPAAFYEGQRILGGMRVVVGLFLFRSLSVTGVILGATLAEAPFPLTPKHNSLIAFFTLGVPTLALAAWAKPQKSGGRLLRVTSRFLVPAVFTATPIALFVFFSWWRVTDDINASQTALTITLVGYGLLLIMFVEPPTRFWIAFTNLNGDRRITLMVILLLIGFMIVVVIGPIRRAFEIAALNPLGFLAIAGVLALWTLLVRWEWKSRVFERLFAVKDI
jgi:cation-transporting ATPase E